MTKNNALALTFTQKVERLFSNNERIIFSQNTRTSKVVISNMGVYCGRRSFFRNKFTVQFYPKQFINAIHYTKQGWLLPSLQIEINVTGRFESFENKIELVPIIIKLHESHQKQAEMLFSYFKNIVSQP